MYSGFYVVFVCDGSVLTSWHYPPWMPLEVTTYPFLKSPIWGSRNEINYDIEIKNSLNLERSIIEGKVLNPQPIIKISNKVTGEAIENLPIFAILIQYNEDGVDYYFPEGYQYQEAGAYAKRLLKPIAAIYHENCTDPFVDWLFKPKLTNVDGEVQFEGLTFTTGGNLGNKGCKLFYHI